MTPISIYLTLYQLAVLHGNQIFHKALYAHIGSEVMISCQISKETSTKSWRKGLTLVTLGLEINRDVRGYRRLEVTIEEGFYNLRINNITEYDFSTYWCETQQGKSVITQGTKLIHLDRQMMSHRTILSDSSETKDSTYRQRTSFQSTLSDSFTTEIKDGTGMHAGNRLFNGLFVTGFVLLC